MVMSNFTQEDTKHADLVNDIRGFLDKYGATAKIGTTHELIGIRDDDGYHVFSDKEYITKDFDKISYVLIKSNDCFEYNHGLHWSIWYKGNIILTGEETSVNVCDREFKCDNEVFSFDDFEPQDEQTDPAKEANFDAEIEWKSKIENDLTSITETISNMAEKLDRLLCETT
jgi:hypothetical protein